MHDRYQLGCWGNDTYVAKYDLPALDCAIGKASANDVTPWYADAGPIADFENRLEHILEHRNALIEGSPAWKDLSSHIFSFNIQNEGQGHLNGNIAPRPEWWCDRATFMRGIMGSSKVLISTGRSFLPPSPPPPKPHEPSLIKLMIRVGGGNEFPNSDIPENWACPALDLVTLHSYSGVDGFRTNGAIALQHALEAGKLTMFEEFGATGETKPDQMAAQIGVFNNLGVPWMPWQISKPGNGASDFEFWTDEETYGVVQRGSEEAQGLRAAQAWDISVV